MVTARAQEKSIIRLSPWGLLDLLFGSYRLRLRKMQAECDWQSVPVETTCRHSQSPVGAASPSLLHWKLQHKAMDDKKLICPLGNLPADVSMSILVICRACERIFSSRVPGILGWTRARISSCFGNSEPIPVAFNSKYFGICFLPS